MVIVLNGTQRQEKQEYFDRLFSLRHQIFVKGRGWALPSVQGPLEIDQYDVDEAVYFFDLDDNDEIRGSVRMTPTDRCSLLADYFPHLIENGSSPRSPLIYEATRYIVLPARSNPTGIRLGKARLINAVVEWCLGMKLSHLQAVVDTATLSSFVEMTHRTMPLGLSYPYGGGRGAPGGGECVAFRWPITHAVLDDVRVYGGLDRAQWTLPDPAGRAAMPSQPVLH
jgi:acyl-homoserine lactone synthase